MDTHPYASEVAARFGIDADPAWAALPDMPVVRQILARRTQRAYLPRAVPPELVRLLCLTALSASAKSDYQQATVIEVRDPGRREALGKMFPAMPWIGASPVFLVFCGDPRRMERIGEFRGHPAGNGGLEGFFNATVDAALAMQTFILAAESAGLGTCPISVLRNRVDEVGDILGLPDKVFPVAGLCVGWPAADGHVSQRLPPAITVHVDRYDDGDLAAHVDAYDRARAARHATPREKQRSPQKFGYADFYGWSEDKARQSAEGEGAAFPPWLRAHGFTFD